MHSRSRRTLQRRVSTHKVILREAWRGPEDVLSEGSTLFYLKLYPLIIQVQWFPVVTSYICVQSALQCQYFNAVAVFPTFTLIDFPLRHLVAFPIQRRLQQTGCRSPPFFFKSIRFVHNYNTPPPTDSYALGGLPGHIEWWYYDKKPKS